MNIRIWLDNLISAPASAEVEDERFHASAPSICHHEMEGDNTDHQVSWFFFEKDPAAEATEA